MAQKMVVILLVIALSSMLVIHGQEITLDVGNPKYDNHKEVIHTQEDQAYEVQLRDFFQVDERTQSIVWSPQAITGLILCCLVGCFLAVICLYINYKEDESPEAFVGRKVFH